MVSVLPLVGIATVTRVALAEAYRIPSGSMEPTLLVGDWLFVNKLRYGPHVPLTGVNLPGYAEPRRGDVVVFVSPPQDPSIRITPDEVTPMLHDFRELCADRVAALGKAITELRKQRDEYMEHEVALLEDQRVVIESALEHASRMLVH